MMTTPARVPAALWKVPAFLDYVQPPLTEEAVAAAEAQLGVKLPGSYLACLRQQNGGYLRRTCRVVGSNVIAGIGPNYPSVTGDKACWRPRNARPGSWAPDRPELLIPFNGEGHWDICFDYRESGPLGEPAITCVVVDSKREKPVAASFAGYLAELVEASAEEEFGIRVRSEVDGESVARTIARGFGRDEPTVDVFAHGYPIWRVELAEGNTDVPMRPRAAAWCWCSPNRVPAGFRRGEHGVITTTETALRFPEDPGCTVVIQCAGSWHARVEDLLRTAGLLS